MSNALDTSSDCLMAILLTFTWGQNPHVARYTSNANPLIIDGVVFQAETRMEAVSGKQHGGSKDQPWTITMALVPPLDTLTAQRTHSVVRVDIEEVDPNDLATRRKLFAGTISRSSRNKEGRSGVVEFDVSGWKQMFDRPLQTWCADSRCQHSLGDQGCKKDLSALREFASITAIDGTELTLSGLTTTATDGYWRFGYVTFDGLSIMVQEYTTGSTLRLMKLPPPSWLGATVVVTPGCDKSLAMCRDRWANEERFTGGGLKIPGYHPLLESS